MSRVCCGPCWPARKEQEEFYVLLLDTKHHLIRDEIVTVGLVDRSQVHAREVFKKAAVRVNCSRVILAHNHTSNGPTVHRSSPLLPPPVSRFSATGAERRHNGIRQHLRERKTGKENGSGSWKPTSRVIKNCTSVLLRLLQNPRDSCVTP